MRHGFIKVAAVTPDVKVADPVYNTDCIIKDMKEAAEAGAKLIVFPELCISSYSCEDLFFQELLLKECQQQLLRLAGETAGMDSLVFVGFPFEYQGNLYNAAAALWRGEVLGIVPKRNIPNYAEFYEARHFTAGEAQAVRIPFQGKEIPFGGRILFECENMPSLVVAAEICEDVWAAAPPSTEYALAGANVIVNLSASDEVIGKDLYRQDLARGQSARLLCAYLYSNAGEGESTTDVVYSGHNLIAENGIVLSESKRFVNETIYADIDLERLMAERRRIGTFRTTQSKDYEVVRFRLNQEETRLSRMFDPNPFVPSDKQDREKRCQDILAIQAGGLKKRMMHTGCKNAVIGISGGLDSTLALLVTARAFDDCGLLRDGITTVTMPCFGTTDRTYANACALIECLGATFREINIRDAVRQHFQDIGQQETNHDVTYENSQARERTQILMDIANQTGGLVVGTGDMSELALGWATYNGDHMSMYAVNCSVPKTLVRHLVRYYADTCGDARLSAVLRDILDTPVSPELLPPEDGQIAQKTEDLVGPYELHDFFLYYMLRFGYQPEKIYRIARLAFAGVYEEETIRHWLKIFYRRFFSQQFKRSCVPDGPKVGSVALSPRGDLRMPSDACARLWVEQVEQL